MSGHSWPCDIASTQVSGWDLLSPAGSAFPASCLPGQSLTHLPSPGLRGILWAAAEASLQLPVYLETPMPTA